MKSTITKSNYLNRTVASRSYYLGVRSINGNSFLVGLRVPVLVVYAPVEACFCL